ncbi:MAG: helix-turn-helix transcriptional regulator [Fretibacterium sp.]|nr:helix-turn-helix transcriptional regulator [Fretibacterium sp.]
MDAAFAETLRRLRPEKGLSQQMAEKLFVNRSSVANWENGRCLPAGKRLWC